MRNVWTTPSRNCRKQIVAQTVGTTRILQSTTYTRTMETCKTGANKMPGHGPIFDKFSNFVLLHDTKDLETRNSVA